MDKVALIIIYNHQYNKNISITENIYGDRFTNIYHLVPFYNGDKSNVIPVYESSYFFQGYVAQGLKSFFKENYSHYFFIGDDLILNPIINEENYHLHLKLGENTSFIPEIINLYERSIYWARVIQAYQYSLDVPGVEAKNQLPDYNTALQLVKEFGLDIKPLTFDQIWKPPVSLNDYVKTLFKDKEHTLQFFSNLIKKKQYPLPYPIIGGYSDIFVISSSTIKQFSHYCGVFAATKLFVELAIPTSLILSTKEIVTENDLELQGKALWTAEDFLLLDRYENKLEKLLDEFPENQLYLHPVKLSKWAANKKSYSISCNA
jgi:hypothetical protein